MHGYFMKLYEYLKNTWTIFYYTTFLNDMIIFSKGYEPLLKMHDKLILITLFFNGKLMGLTFPRDDFLGECPVAHPIHHTNLNAATCCSCGDTLVYSNAPLWANDWVKDVQNVHSQWQSERTAQPSSYPLGSPSKSHLDGKFYI